MVALAAVLDETERRVVIVCTQPREDPAGLNSAVLIRVANEDYPTVDA